MTDSGYELPKRKVLVLNKNNKHSSSVKKRPKNIKSYSRMSLRSASLQHLHHLNGRSRLTSANSNNNNSSNNHSEGDLRWKKSRSAFRLKALLVLLALGLPGNLYVLYCYNNPISEDDLVHDVEDTDVKDDDEVFKCYEDADLWEPRLFRVRYWVEGVILSVVGLVGLAGKDWIKSEQIHLWRVTW